MKTCKAKDWVFCKLINLGLTFWIEIKLQILWPRPFCKWNLWGVFVLLKSQVSQPHSQPTPRVEVTLVMRVLGSPTPQVILPAASNTCCSRTRLTLWVYITCMWRPCLCKRVAYNKQTNINLSLTTLVSILKNSITNSLSPLTQLMFFFLTERLTNHAAFVCMCQKSIIYLIYLYHTTKANFN